MNLVALIGNVAQKPELRYTANGRAVCTFRLAVSRSGMEQADFFTVVAWERQAEICGQYLEVGRRVGVEGRLHHSTWDGSAGRRSAVEVVAHRVQLIGSRAKASAEPEAETGPEVERVPETENGGDFAALAGTGNHEDSSQPGAAMHPADCAPDSATAAEREQVTARAKITTSIKKRARGAAFPSDSSLKSEQENEALVPS